MKDCSDAGGVIGASDPVALVQPHGKEVALRDYADPAHPRTLCRFSFAGVVQLIDSRHIVVKSGYGPGSDFAVVDLPQMTNHFFQLRPLGPFGECTDLLGVSPGLDALTWRTYNVASGPQSIHITTAAGDRVVDTLPNHTSCSNPTPFAAAAYSPSGQYVSFLDRLDGLTRNTLVVLDGTHPVLKLTPPTRGWASGAEPSNPVWSPVRDTLFYQQNGRIWTWTPGGGAQQFLAGVSWCYPTVSADGRYLAYGALRADGLYDATLLELKSGQVPQAIGKGPRNLPVFLNSNLLWYQTWSHAVCGGGDGSNGPKLAGQPLVYDTTDGSEAPTLLDQVFEVWPATGYGYTGVWPDATTAL
jgi:hypothetical protein